MLTLLVSAGFAQRTVFETDIFGDLRYESNGYRATLKKDIFDALTFSDSNGNEIVFEEKYLDSEYRQGLSNDKDAKAGFFRRLIHRYSPENGYRAKYSVDIFGTTVIEDNRGNKIEMGTDIFGNPTYKEKSGGVESSFSRSLNGTLEYRSGRESASLGKDIFNKWTYSDSSGNKFEFSPQTWSRLEKRFGSDENVFMFLVRELIP